MSLLPVIEMVARLLGLSGIPGSVVFVQQLTLWVAFLGAALAATGDRLLSLSANTFLPEKWTVPARVFGCGLTTAIAASLCWASFQFVVSERTGGKMLALGVPAWAPAAVMPVGLLLVTVRAIGGAGPKTSHRLAAALFLLVPLALAFAPQPQGSLVLWIGIPVVLAGAVLGVPIFATLGGVALLLLWSVGQPAATVPDNAYSLMVSDVLPSLPLYTLAGYLLVEGGAAVRLLRVYTALFGWPCHHHSGGLRHLHVGGIRSDHCFDGRIAAADAGEGGLSAALFHWIDQRLGLARPAVSAQPAGDLLCSLCQECAYRRPVCGRLCARPSDGIDGFGLGRVARHSQRRRAIQVLIHRCAQGGVGG
jgi:TRAP-type C4-dicarboxylate transport system permease small subunit